MSILTSQQKEFYSENGYLIVRQLIDQHTVIELRKSLMQVLEVNDEGIRNRSTHRRSDGTYTTHIQQLYQTHSVLTEYIHNPKLGSILSELMQNTPEVRLLHDGIIYKSPYEGGPVNWHQDYFTWQNFTPPDMVTAWTALSKSSEESGCVYVVPGSHKWGLMQSNETIGFGSDVELFLKESVQEQYRSLIVKKPLILEPGDVSFHHCLTLHGSYRNISDYYRLGYIIHSFPAHTRHESTQDDALARAYGIDVPVGELIRGKNFPLLWNASVEKK